MLLLTYRAAAVRGLSVEEWREQTPEHEQPYWLALVWMDAHGEQYAEIAGMVHNTTRTKAEDCLPSSRWLRLDRYRDSVTEITPEEIEAARGAYASLAMGGRRE